MAGRGEALREIIEPVVIALGYQLWGIEYVGQGKHSLLRVFIDSEGGINIEDCAETSRQISSILDVEDPISGECTIEVSYPGLDRILFSIDQFSMYTGARVKLRLRENFEGRRNYTGIIKAVINDEVVVVNADDEYVFPYELVEKANIVADIEPAGGK